MRRSTRSFLLLAAAALAAGLAAPSARAGAKPHIEEIQCETPFPGSVLTIVGTNFSDDFKDVRVTCDEKPCVVLPPTKPERLLAKLPEIGEVTKGKHGIVVTVGGERSNKVEIEVHGEDERREKAEHDKLVHEGGENAIVKKHLLLDAPQASFTGGELVISAPGKADYPDGALVRLELRLDQVLIAGVQAEVQAGSFKAIFGPYKKRLFAGNYWIEAWFELARQSGSIRRAFRESVKDPAKQQEFANAHDRQFVRVGTVAEEDFQSKELKSYFQSALSRSKDLLRELETNYSAAGRSMFRKDGKVDEAEWEAWLKKRSLHGVPGDEYAARVKEMRGVATFLNKDGSFNDQAWREWLDFKWREDGVLKLVKDHVAFIDKYLVPKNGETLGDLEKIYATLVRLSQARSMDLYKGNGLPPAEKDTQVGGTAALGLGGGGGPATPSTLDMYFHKVVKGAALDAPDAEAGGGGK
jgi:hypothetical protein